MWTLHSASAGADWTTIGTFDSLKDAARRIIEIEGLPVSGVFFQTHVSSLDGSDDEALSHLEYTGRTAAYVVKRQRH